MSRINEVGRAHTAIATENGQTSVYYHGTPVVRFGGGKPVTLNTGGYFTVTTKRRMNQAANQYGLGFQVYQKAGKWYVEHHSGKVDVFIGDTITLD